MTSHSVSSIYAGYDIDLGLLHRLVGQGVARQSSAHSIVEMTKNCRNTITEQKAKLPSVHRSVCLSVCPMLVVSQKRRARFIEQWSLASSFRFSRATVNRPSVSEPVLFGKSNLYVVRVRMLQPNYCSCCSLYTSVTALALLRRITEKSATFLGQSTTRRSYLLYSTSAGLRH